MIKKLQMKFIFLSMTALLAVLFVIIASINIVNYRKVIMDADTLLTVLSENKGTFPMDNRKKDGPVPPELSPEVPYESRYFSVSLDNQSRTVVRTETSRIISVDEDDAVNYAQAALQNTGEYGFVNHFRYMKYTDNGIIQFVFLDCGRTLDSFYDFLYASAGISIAGYLVVFALIAFFSRRIIRPISESYEKQKQFITDAGHEIKTPLTIINADTGVLEIEYGKNEWLEDIQKQTKRLADLTNDLVYLARMEETSAHMQMIEFPLSDITEEMAASFQTLAQTQTKTIRCNIQPMLSLTGDTKAIRQLIGILLDNALKYSPAGSTVLLSLKQQNKHIVLSVCNETEHVIDREKLSLLFERFYRLDASRNSKTGGYGIGLSVAKAIVAAHNGKIRAKTDDGRSLSITATFPM